MTNKNTLNSSIIAKQYSDEAEAYKFLENMRWENGIVCPHCKNTGADYIETENRQLKIQKTLETLYHGIGGDYYYGDAAWKYVSDRTEINLKEVLEKIAEERSEH